MQKREIGRSGLFVNPIGLGCMGLSEFYGPAVSTADGVSLLHEAIARGVNHFDTAEMYGMGANEALLGEAFVSVHVDTEVHVAVVVGHDVLNRLVVINADGARDREGEARRI